MILELLYLPGCPNHRAAADLVREILQAEGLNAELTETPIPDYAAAKAHRFPGSPTLRVNGRDVEESTSDQLQVGFACRTYAIAGRTQGTLPCSLVESAIRAARKQENLR